MQLVLEWEEIERLLRAALANEGLCVPAKARMFHRLNNEKRTVRLVFTDVTQSTDVGRKKKR